MWSLLERLLPFLSVGTAVAVAVWDWLTGSLLEQPSRGRNRFAVSDGDPFSHTDGSPVVNEPTQTIQGTTFHGPVLFPDSQVNHDQLRFEELRRAAEDAARRNAIEQPLDEPFEQRAPESDATWWVIDEPLSSEEEHRVAEQTADSINDTLARLFVRLGPPPTALGGSGVPVSNGDGGSAQ